MKSSASSLSPSLRDVLADALRFSDEERALIAAELLASLHAEGTPTEDDPAWRAEVERRADRVRRGESDGLAWEDVLVELERA